MEKGSGSGNFTGNATVPLPSGAEIASQPHWIISFILALLIILTNLWIAIAFYHHIIATKVLKKKRSKRDVNGGLVMILAMSAVVVPFFRYFGTLFLLFVSLDPTYVGGCEIANDILVVGFGLAVLPTYAFLWARQRAFYGHPSLGHMFGKCVSVFSSISIVLIVLSAVCALALGIYPVEYTEGDGGCVLIGGEEQDDYRTYIYAVIMISSQLVLLGLFLHPIRIHAQQQKGLETSNKVVVTKSEMAELSSTDGLSSSGEGATNSVAAEEYHRLSAQTGNTESPKATRSLSVPVNQHLKRISNDLAPHRKSSAEIHSETDDRKRSRAGTMQSDNNGHHGGGYSFTAVKAMARLKKKVRKTTLRTRKVHRLIKRVMYLALVSVISDLTCMIINAFIIPDDIPQTYSFVLFDANVLVNVITVVLSFENWRAMMLSPCNIDVMTKR